MPTFNSAAYVRTAIKSIVEQTFRQWELIVIDDASTDATVDVVRSFNDSRICLVENKSRTRLAASRNAVLEMARGNYIAWLDADDVANRHRLEQQTSFMEANQRVGACGTWALAFGRGVRQRILRMPTDPDSTRIRILFNAPVVNSSSMVRLAVLKAENLAYDVANSEDYDLWERLGVHAPIVNLPLVLCGYRYHSSQTTTVDHTDSLNYADAVRSRELERLGIQPSDGQLRLHSQLSVPHAYPDGSAPDLSQMARWLEDLWGANEGSSRFEPIAYKGELGDRWLSLIRRWRYTSSDHFGVARSHLKYDLPGGAQLVRRVFMKNGVGINEETGEWFRRRPQRWWN